MKTCHQCELQFEVFPQDRDFYERISPVFDGKKYQIPEPTLCPDCRQKRRMAFRNERKLYSRPDSLSGKQIISMYSPDKPFIIYPQKDWWSDTWDPMAYGQDFDSNKTFAEQFKNLLLKVPRESIFITNCENCEYNNYIRDSKDCYLCSLVSNGTRNAYYSYWIVKSTDIFDCLSAVECELLYECINTYNSYDCRYLNFCKNCENCIFGYGLIGCSHCFGCVNMQNKQYCFFNKQCSKEEYKGKLTQINRGSYKEIEDLKKQFDEFRLQHPYRASTNLNVENCVGENIRDMRNGYYVFDGFESEDIRYTNGFFYSKDCLDCYALGSYRAELIYEGCVVYGNNTVLFSTNIIRGDKIYYSDSLISCSDCFGCVGLKHKQYCIFNKQYTKDEYEKLVFQIIENMIKNNEWGEFFDPRVSPFGYNETVAQDYFTIDKMTAVHLGFNWSDFEPSFPRVEKTVSADKLQDTIFEVSDEILDYAIECEITKKPFRIIRQELDFYRKNNLPLPRKHPDLRHKERFLVRNLRKLWARKCNKCGVDIQTTYAPDRQEIIYCEGCYQGVVE
ncbi:MAG: hypothetical protein NTZ80_00495 [Patescibacteria group bacterium]|nr:hypothetical protein [Patescibacteria group bacterium]